MVSLWSSRRKEPESNFPSISLKELDEKYDVVKVVDDEPGKEFAIVTPRRNELGVEMGTSSASPFTSFVRQEYNPALMGITGLEMYDKMRKSDGTVRGTLRAVKTPALTATWFVKPASDSSQDIEIAKFVECCLFDYMSTGWIQTLTEALLMLDFGYYMFEKVWDVRIIKGEPRVILKKLGPRHPMDVKSWKFDVNGGPESVTMYSDKLPLEEDVTIPIRKMLVFTFDKEAGNIEGVSILRSAYKHWYYKEQLYKIDAIQKERHGIGIPVIKLPMGFKEKDKVAAENLGRNIRTNERAHIVLPPGWDIAMLKLEGQPVDALESVEHHNACIRENILVNFIRDGAEQDDLVMFFKAVRFVADILAETVNHYLLPQLVDMNFPDVEEYPKLTARRIGDATDWRTFSFAVRNLIGAGAIIPDDVLEAELRKEMELPLADPSTARDVAGLEEDDTDLEGRESAQVEPDSTNNQSANYNRGNRRKKTRKQRGQLAGMPRQALVGNQRVVGKRPPQRNAGVDRSGG